MASASGPGGGRGQQSKGSTAQAEVRMLLGLFHRPGSRGRAAEKAETELASEATMPPEKISP